MSICAAALSKSCELVVGHHGDPCLEGITVIQPLCSEAYVVLRWLGIKKRVYYATGEEKMLGSL